MNEYDDFWANEEKQIKKAITIFPEIVEKLNDGKTIIADTYAVKNVCEVLKIPHVRRDNEDVYMCLGGCILPDTIEHAQAVLECMIDECRKHI